MNKTKDKRNKFLIIGYILTSFTVFFFGFMLLRFPSYSGEGIRKGIELCLYTLIPSMYPFMFLSAFLVSSGIIEKSERLFLFLTKILFRLPGICGSVFFLSILGGYPIGAKIISEMYENGMITKNQGQRLMLFCVNPAPSFVITSVGYYMLNSKKAGAIIYLSVIISSLIIGIFTNFIFKDSGDFSYYNSRSKKVTVSESFVSSVSDSGRGMLVICAWVLLFSSVSSIIEVFQLPQNVKVFLCSFLEVTNGCTLLVKSYGIPVLSAAISFGGLCVQMQLMSVVIRLKMKAAYFFCSRLINAVMSFVISSFLLRMFPLAVETISIGTLPVNVNSGSSVSVTVGLMTMCIIMLLGDGFYIRRKNKKIIR